MENFNFSFHIQVIYFYSLEHQYSCILFSELPLWHSLEIMLKRIRELNLNCHIKIVRAAD